MPDLKQLVRLSLLGLGVFGITALLVAAVYFFWLRQAEEPIDAPPVASPSPLTVGILPVTEEQPLPSITPPPKDQPGKQKSDLCSVNTNTGTYTSLTEAFLEPTRVCHLVLQEKMTELPPEIIQLRNLVSLNANSLGLRELPPQIGQLKQLRLLMLSGNELTRLPAQIGQLAFLEKLTLDANGLRELPPEFFQLYALRELSLRHNDFSAEERQRIRSQLPEVTIYF